MADEEQRQAIQDGFVGVIRKKLGGQITRSEAREEMLAICHEQLDAKDFTVLQKAFQDELAPRN